MLAQRGAVDLESVEWKTLEVAQRGVASSKVVYFKPNVHRLQPVEGGKHLLGISHDGAFRHLKCEKRRIQAGFGQCRFNITYQAGIA